MKNDTPKPEVKVEAKPAVTPKKSIRDKSFLDILVEGNERRRQAAKEDAGKTKVEDDPNSLIKEQMDYGNKSEETPKEEKPNKVEEKAVEVKEEKKKKKTEDIIKETVPLAVKESLAEERKREAEEKVKAEETAKKEEETKQVQKELEATKNFTPIWVAEKRDPKTWTEVASELERKNDLMIKAEFAERDRKAQEERQKAEDTSKSEKERNAALDAALQSEIDADLNDLYATGKLPRIKNETDENDEGIIAKKALFAAGMKVNNERIAKGLPPIRSLKLIYYEHYKAPEKQPAGADAPNLGNGVAPRGETNPSFASKGYHKKGFRDILVEGIQRARGRA